MCLYVKNVFYLGVVLCYNTVVDYANKECNTVSRKEARNLLFKMVFELCFHKPEESETFEQFTNNDQLSQENKEFVETIYKGIIEKYDDLINEISKHIKGYTIERLFKVDLAILLMATYELLYYEQTPKNVVINEAVELSKKYSTDKSYGYINAVLGSIINKDQ